MLSGTPTSDVGDYTWVWRAFDINGSEDTLTFTVTVVAPPVFAVDAVVPDQTYTDADGFISVPLPAIVGGTGAGELTYSVSGPVTGVDVVIPAATGVPTLQGTPAAPLSNLPTGSDPKAYEMTYTGADANGAFATLTFTITLYAQPELPDAAVNLTFTAGFPLAGLYDTVPRTLPEATGGRPPLSYALFGETLPGLTMHPTSRLLSGTPEEPAGGALTFNPDYEAQDANDARSSPKTNINIVINPGITFNADSNVVADTNVRYTKDETIVALTLPTAGSGTGALSFTLTYAQSDPVTGAFPADSPFTGLMLTTTGGVSVLSGDINGTGGQLVWTATDATGASFSLNFGVVSSGPFFTTSVSPQTYTQFKAIEPLTLPTATPGDPGIEGAEIRSHVLTGLDQITGLSVNNFIIRGTPTVPGDFTLTFTATDGQSPAVSASLLVNITIIPQLAFNAHSVETNQSFDVGMTFTLTLPDAEGGVDPLGYVLTPDPLPSWLDFDAGTPATDGNGGVLTGAIPNDGDFANLTFTVTDSATDAQEIELVFRVGSAGPYFDPGASITNRLYIQNRGEVREDDATAEYPVFTPTAFPAAIPDETAAGGLTYSVLDGAGLLVAGSPGADPTFRAAPGLNFNPSSRQLRGTPTHTADSESMTYRVSDGERMAELGFTLRVVPELLIEATVADQEWPQGVTYRSTDSDGAVSVGLELPAVQGGVPVLTFEVVAANNGSLPAGMTFTESTRLLSGVPTESGSHLLTYRVTDALNASSVETFGFTVTEPDVVFVEEVRTIGYEAGDSVNMTLPEAYAAGAVTYSLGPAEALTALSFTFTPTSRVLSGNPPAPVAISTSSASGLSIRTTPTPRVAVSNDFVYAAVSAGMTMTQQFSAVGAGAGENEAPVFNCNGEDLSPCPITLNPRERRDLDLSRYFSDDAPAGDELRFTADVATADEDTVKPTGPAFRANGRDMLPLILGANPGSVADLTITATDLFGLTYTRTLRVTLSGGRAAAREGKHAALNEALLPEIARAIADQNVSAIARRIRQAKESDGAPRRTIFNLGGASTLDGIFTTHTQSLVEGTLNWRRLLSNSQITVPLGGLLNGGAGAGSADSPSNPAAEPLAAAADSAPGAANSGKPESESGTGGITGNAFTAGLPATPAQADTRAQPDIQFGAGFSAVNAFNAFNTGAPGVSGIPTLNAYGAGDNTPSTGFGTLAFWASGDYRSLSGKPKDNDLGLDWESDLYAAHFGADMRPTPDTLAGLALSWNQSEVDYKNGIDPADEDNILSGEHNLELVTLSPYFAWSALDGRLDLWAVAGYGAGELEIKSEAADDADDDDATGDAEMQTLALGANGILLQRGASTLRLKAEAMRSTLEIENTNGGIAAVEVDASRARVAVEASRAHTGKGGVRLEPSLEIGLRQDGGDGETGSAVELGAGITRTNTNGLSMSGRIYALFGESDADEWGIQGNLNLFPQATRGFALRLSPGYGAATTDVQQIWEQDLVAAATDGASANDSDYAPRMDARLSYTLPTRQGLLTPFSEFTLGDTRSYRLGLDWKLAPQFDLNLTGERSGDGGDNPENAILLKGTLEF